MDVTRHENFVSGNENGEDRDWSESENAGTIAATTNNENGANDDVVDGAIGNDADTNIIINNDNDAHNDANNDVNNDADNANDIINDDELAQLKLRLLSAKRAR